MKQVRKWMIATLALSTVLTPSLIQSTAYAANSFSNPTTSATLPFSDLNGVSPEQLNQIQRAVQAGLLHGDPNHRFRPVDTLTRQEMAVLLTQSLQLPLGTTATEFSDVQPSDWASRYIKAAQEAGLMIGYGDGTFRPQAPVTREELAVLLMRSAQFPLGEGADAADVADWHSVSQWAQPFVRTALENGSIDAVGSNFQPQTPVLRQEIAGFLLGTFFPTDRPGFLQQIAEGQVTINGVAYQLADSVKGLLQPANSAVLQGAKIQFSADDRTLRSISRLELHASGQAPSGQDPEFSGNLVLDGHGATLDGDLVLAGNYLTVQNLNVSHDLQITPQLENDFFARHLNVQGKTLIQGGDENTVEFAQSELQDVEVAKPGVHVVTQENSSVKLMTVSTDATLTNDASSTLQQVTVTGGAQQVNLQGPIQQVVVESDRPTTLTGDAAIGMMVVNSSAPLNLNGTGAVSTLQVNNPAANVLVAASLDVPNVSFAADVPPSTVTKLGSSSGSTVTNTAPKLVTPFDNQAMTVGDSDLQVSVLNHFLDAEQTDLKYAVSSLNSKICKATLVGDTIVLTPVARGTVTIAVVADDRAGKKANASFTVTVNDPPHSTGITDQTKQIGTGDVTLSLHDFFTDADGDLLTYQVSVEDLSIATYALSADQLTLTPAQVGSTKVTVQSSDGRGGLLTESFHLHVTAAPNQDPVVEQTPGNRTLTVGQADYTFDLSPLFSDPDQDALTYEAESSHPSFATVSVSGAQATVHTLASGTTTIRLTAKDGRGGEVTTEFQVTINEPPVIATLPAQTLQAGDAPTTIDLSSYLSDLEQDALTVTATSAASSIAAVSVAGSTLTLTPNAAGSTTVTIIVTDRRGGTAISSLAVTVNAAPAGNNAPVVTAAIYEQVLTAGVTNARTFDLSQLFEDPDGDILTFTALTQTTGIVSATISGNNLTLLPDATAGSTIVQITANDGKGGSTTYSLNVRNAPLAPNGKVEIRTKQGVKDPIVYDLASHFPGQTTFQLYKGTSDSTLTGPQTLNGKLWTWNGDSLSVWVIGTNGTAVVLNVIVEPQGSENLYFSQYMDLGNGRTALQLFHNVVGGTPQQISGYELEVHQYKVQTGTKTSSTYPLFSFLTGTPYLFIDQTFYDLFDMTNVMSFNDELAMYDQGKTLTTGFVLKKGGVVIDVLGDPNANTQFMPNGGTIIRKSGIRVGSSAFRLHGEWNNFPVGTFQYLATHTE